MKIKSLLLPLALIGAASLPAKAEEAPIVTFRTSIYETYGEANSFHIVLGGTPGEYVYVDCGFGEVEVELEEGVVDVEAGGMSGVSVPCQVSEAGIVKIYGDPTAIDYFDAEGCYLREIDLSKLTELRILDLSHNELEKLDLSSSEKLEMITLSDNPFNVSPLKIGPNKPNLTILEMSIIDNLDQSFNLSDYPAMASFEAYHCTDLRKVDPSGCPGLLRLSIDVTPVEKLDVSANRELMILNISDTKITSIDLSNNPYLTEFYCTHDGPLYKQWPLTELDVTNNTNLQRFFASGNKLTSLDLTQNVQLVNLGLANNLLSSLDLSNCGTLYSVDIRNNCFSYASLPEPGDTWGEYYYSQRPLTVDRSYPVGTTIDFASQVLRENTETTAKIYVVDKNNPYSQSELETSAYRYDNGKLTLLQATTDSVYVSFSNTLFPEYPLTTGNFMVKSASEFGQPVQVVTLVSQSGTPIQFGVGMQGASATAPKKFLVDFGDGNLKEFTATTSATPDEPNVSGMLAGGGRVTIFVNEGDDLTAFSIKGKYLNALDVTAAPLLSELTVVDGGLYRLDLQWNRLLTRLQLNGNNLTTFDLEGPNYTYAKNLLGYIDLSNNQIEELSLNDRAAIRHIDLSHNKIKSVDLERGYYIEWIDLSYNELTELRIGYQLAATYCKATNNQINVVTMPETCVLETFDISNNDLQIATLPVDNTIANYIYAPQNEYAIPAKGPGVDLSSQVRVIDGETTLFTWKNLAGDIMTEGVDYSNDNGVILFKNVDMGQIYCEMSHPAFPKLTGENAYRTTTIEAAGMPTSILASFKTAESGDMSLTLTASKPGIAVYVDWSGDKQKFDAYDLETTYKVFAHEVKAGAEVNIYTYDEDELTVFSIGGVKLQSVDASKLSKLSMFGVSGAGLKLDKIAFPVNSNLRELALVNNDIDSFDGSKFSNLTMLHIDGNNLKSLDTSMMPNLQSLTASRNQLESVMLDNQMLWELSLSTNQLKDIDLSKVPGMYQMMLDHNQLSTIDVSKLNALRVMFLDYNEFLFSTLPAVRPQYGVYTYANQADIQVEPVDGIVDLSSQYLDGTTTYTWYYDTPILNEEGVLEGEELVEGEDYEIENGVTKFLVDIDKAVCCMTNTNLPNLNLFTPILNVTAAGVDSITIDGDDAEPVYYNLQGVKIDNPTSGLYIVVRGNEVSKQIVK